MNNFKKIITYLIIVVIALSFVGCGKKEEPTKNEENKEEKKEEPVVSKFKIYDTTTKSRPYAISVNNTNVAVKVQEGLNKAYIVYEIPTEFHTTRLLALFRDVNDVNVGTIRSCRHNFLDYADENDAILICFGWSHYAEDELNKGGTDFMNGNESKWASAFWRSNPEKLDREHTAYTSLAKITDFTQKNNYRLTSDETQLLNYNAEEITLDNIEGNTSATVVTIPFGGTTAKFNYDANTKMYTRVVNGVTNKDHNTKEAFTAKNIIIAKIGHSMTSDNYYWDLKNTGTGKGYYITNGKSVPITWKKDSRKSKTKYFYQDGTEIQVNDGRTYIELSPTDQNVSIK